jgi:hypothetical protein
MVTMNMRVHQVWFRTDGRIGTYCFRPSGVRVDCVTPIVQSVLISAAANRIRFMFGSFLYFKVPVVAGTALTNWENNQLGKARHRAGHTSSRIFPALPISAAACALLASSKENFWPSGIENAPFCTASAIATRMAGSGMTCIGFTSTVG